MLSQNPSQGRSARTVKRVKPNVCYFLPALFGILALPAQFTDTAADPMKLLGRPEIAHHADTDSFQLTTNIMVRPFSIAGVTRMGLVQPGPFSRYGETEPPEFGLLGDVAFILRQ